MTFLFIFSFFFLSSHSLHIHTCIDPMINMDNLFAHKCIHFYGYECVQVLKINPKFVGMNEWMNEKAIKYKVSYLYFIFIYIPEKRTFKSIFNNTWRNNNKQPINADLFMRLNTCYTNLYRHITNFFNFVCLLQFFCFPHNLDNFLPYRNFKYLRTKR